MTDEEEMKPEPIMKPTALDYCCFIFEHLPFLPPYVKINILSEASLIDLGQRLIATCPVAPGTRERRRH